MLGIGFRRGRGGGVPRKRMSYANVAATLALVLAVTGGSAYAASYVITSTSQIKPSVLASLRGNRGPTGPTGKAGKDGVTGATGNAGTNGVTGATGVAGTTGATGTTGTTGNDGATGPTGPTGPSGQAGTPGSVGATGPSGPTGTLGSVPAARTEQFARIEDPKTCTGSATVPDSTEVNPVWYSTTGGLDFDTDGLYHKDTTCGLNDGLQAPISGTYIATAQVSWNNPSTAGYREIALRINGTDTDSVTQTPIAITLTNQNISEIFHLNSGDLVQLEILQTGGAGVGLQGASLGLAYLGS
jgi:hypothetical protein